MTTNGTGSPVANGSSESTDHPGPATRDFTPLFDPRSVAVVGASDDGSKYGNWLATQALRMADRRQVHLVNRRGGRVLGRSTAPGLRDLAEPVEMAVLTVPPVGFEAAVDDALAAGARAIVGVTSGFAESGAHGQALQERVVRRVRDSGAALVGPNCLGLYDSTTGLTVTSNTMPAGRIALLSQSGNVALELGGALAQLGHGFSRFVSLGNQADVDVADLVEDCAHHDGTDVIAVYCEEFKDGRRFVAAAAEAHRRGKPVVVLTVGGSEASVRGAKSHTGSMTTRSDVVDAACEAAGAYRVHSPRQLVHVAVSLLRFGVVPVHRVAIVADGGGHASLACDLAEQGGLTVPAFSPLLHAETTRLLPGAVATANPVDIGSGPGLDIGAFAEVTEMALASTEVDAVLVTGYFGGYDQYGAAMTSRELEVAERLGRAASEVDKPVLVHTMFPDGPAAQTLRSHGVPVFAATDDATETLALLAAHPHPREGSGAPTVVGPAMRRAGYAESRRLLEDADIVFPASCVVASPDDAADAARAVGLPVVVKAMGLLHKSDRGGVALDLGSVRDVRRAAQRMEASLRPEGYSVESMVDVTSGVELIVGAQVDPRFGPVLSVGLGGTLAEVLADVSHALAPVDDVTARSMLARLRCSPVFDAFRGRPALDLDAAVAAIVALGDLAAAHPEITEIEVNPLLVTPTGAVALDSRVVLRDLDDRSEIGAADSSDTVDARPVTKETTWTS